MDLKKTISILYDMELNNFYMTNAISEMEKKMKKLGKRDPTKAVRNPEVGKEPFNEPLPYKNYFLRSSIVCYSLLSCGIIGFTIGMLTAMFTDFDIAILLFPIIGVGIGWPLGEMIAWYKRENDYNKGCDYYNARYEEHIARMSYDIQKEFQRVRNEAAMDSDRVNKELLEKKLVAKNCLMLEKKKKDAENKLKTFYKQSGIDPKFHNIVAMGYMYEFIRLGVATKLEGTDGLYYLIMKELRWDQMQHSLTTICDNLENVVDNQRMIYGELVSMRRESQMMVERIMYGVNNLSMNVVELKRVAELNGERMENYMNTLNRNVSQVNSNLSELKAVQEYGNKRIAKELEYQNYMAKNQNWINNNMMKEQNDILKFGY